MAHNDDLRVLLDVPFLKNGMVIYVSSPDSGQQDLYIAQNRDSIREQFAASDFRFIFIPDLLESIPESMQEYLFPMMEHPSQDAIYAHIRKTAQLENKTGLLYQREWDVFFREFGPESIQEEISELAEEFALGNESRFRMTPAMPDIEMDWDSFPGGDEVIYPAEEQSEQKKEVSWIRKQYKQAEASFEDAFEGTMGGLFDDDMDFSPSETAYVPPVEKVQPGEEAPLDERTKAILAEIDELYLVVSIRNRSAESYELSEQRFAIEGLRRSRWGLQVEKAMFPRQVYGLGPAQPGGYARMVFAFDKIPLTHGQMLRVYLYEDGGARNYVVEIGRKDVEGARGL